MAEQFERTKPHMNIGTIGHVDHGKTTFTAAMSHMSKKMGYSKGEAIAFENIDNAPEERERGITIKASTIEFETANRHYSSTDCPGHEDYIKNMITGASQADCLILLIAAVDGKMQQTTEHILLAKQIGVKNLIIFINKVDMIDDSEMLELVELEAAELAEENGFPNAIILQGSALGALEGKEEYEQGILKVFEALDSLPLPERKTDKPFLMPIEGVNTIPGRGTVVVGKIERGVVKSGDAMYLVSQKKKSMDVTVTGVQTFKKELAQGEAGDNVGLLLRGVDKKEVSRGDLIVKKGTLSPVGKFQAEIYVLTPDEGGRTKAFAKKYSPQFYFRTSDVTGEIQGIMENKDGKLHAIEMAMPGDNVTIEVALKHMAGVEEKMNFAIREGGRTIAVGLVTKILDV